MNQLIQRKARPARTSSIGMLVLLLAGACAGAGANQQPEPSPGATSTVANRSEAEPPRSEEAAHRFRYLEADTVVATVDPDGRILADGDQAGQVLGDDTLETPDGTTWRLSRGGSTYAAEQGAWVITVDDGAHAVLVAENGGLTGDGLDIAMAADGSLSGSDPIGFTRYRIDAPADPAQRRLASMILVYLVQALSGGR